MTSKSVATSGGKPPPSLVCTRTERHTDSKPHRVECATLNIRSLNKKAEAIKQLLSDTGTDILCLTETWYEDYDAVSLKRLRSKGFQVLKRARPIPPDDSLDDICYTNHGGIAIIRPTNIRLAKLQTGFDLSTFEHLCVRINSCGINCIALVIYRPGSEHVTQQFFEELSKLLAYLATLSAPIFITGDFNIRLDRLNDPPAIQLNELLASLGLSQQVDHPTHDLGSILDVVLII